MLPQKILSAIEKDYDDHIAQDDIKYLSRGDNGSVYYLTSKNNMEFCVKSIAKHNDTAKKDYEIYKAVYGKTFSFKFYSDSDYSYFTMPFFHGKTLETLLYIKDLSLETRLTIFKRLIEAVRAMHANGVIHRDLKSSNIIVNLKNAVEVNIIDFGRSVQVFDERGKPVASCEDLALDNNTNLFFQFVRKYQSQTAPEYSSVCNTLRKWIGARFFSTVEETRIGFRSDYYALGTLFQAFIPEHAELANDLISKEWYDRNQAFYDLCNGVDAMLEKLRRQESVHVEDDKINPPSLSA